MAVVTINVTPTAVIITPATIAIDRVDQTITWKLQGGTWEPDGIVFNNVPAGCVPWTGSAPQLDSNGDYVAVAKKNEGSSNELYAYTINIRDTTGSVYNSAVSNNTPQPSDNNPQVVPLRPGNGVIEIDPGIENQPVP